VPELTRTISFFMAGINKHNINGITAKASGEKKQKYHPEFFDKHLNHIF
jgi:hypothetical protein